MKHIFYFYIILAAALLQHLFPGECRGTDSITLPEAVSRALKKNPALAVYSAETRIADARIISALARPNPELETEVEDVLGSGEYDGFRSAVYNVGVSQLIETGKKRRLRGAVAEAEQNAQALEYDIARREIIAETGKRYVAVLASQNAEANAEADYKTASEAYAAIKEQIKGGRGTAIDSGQALLGKNEAKIARESARLESNLARQQLSAMWAEAKPSFDSVVGNLPGPGSEVPEMGNLCETIDSHPLVARAEAGVSAAGSQLTLEEKKKIPDVSVGVGYRRDSAVDDNALVMGFSLPLPLFNKNEGGIAEAKATIERNEALVAQARIQVEMLIATARARLVSARMEYELISGEMLSGAADQYQTVSEGVSLGRIQYLELLEARRALNAVRKQRLEALAKYHSARVDLEAITGSKL
ncbi:TolC family protein [Verrucomicrobiales bacterium BCK34]|nr:TolC family protein [Verrucomicrobiales bacterium BCK34]